MYDNVEMFEQWKYPLEMLLVRKASFIVATSQVKARVSDKANKQNQKKKTPELPRITYKSPLTAFSCLHFLLLFLPPSNKRFSSTPDHMLVSSSHLIFPLIILLSFLSTRCHHSISACPSTLKQPCPNLIGKSPPSLSN